MKIGIIFGGASREREISFAGGRTVYDNLDRDLFEPVPIFMDSGGKLVLLDWQYVYKGSIRDFYPPAEDLPAGTDPYQIYAESVDSKNEQQTDILRKIGTPVAAEDLSKHIDMAFLALHGALGEDGVMQAVLERQGIPYTGSGIMASSIGMDKAFQKDMMQKAGFETPKNFLIKRRQWKTQTESSSFFEEAVKQVQLPFVIRPASQGSSIGVSMQAADCEQEFIANCEKAFFLKSISKTEWDEQKSKHSFIQSLIDLREGLGLPLLIKDQYFDHPVALEAFISLHFEASDEPIQLEGLHKENEIIVEEFLDGKEFSCIVLRDEDNQSLALPPTEIRKGKEIFDYRSKYLAGLSSKITPIDLPTEQIRAIQDECCRLFDFFRFNVYARIDGFIKADGRIYLNDPNTTSGMLPSSFFFHQAAEIGLTPSQFLTLILRQSLMERVQHNALPTWYKYQQMLDQLDRDLEALKARTKQKTKIAVILGGYSAERHISVESGRNIYEKLSSSDKYEPIPFFLTGSASHFELFHIPINILLKDNADDIVEKIRSYTRHEIIDEIKERAKAISEKYAYHQLIDEPVKVEVADLSKMVDYAFIALHGRPGEDGALQTELEKYHIPYNGSGVPSSQITIDKFDTGSDLRNLGMLVATQEQLLKKNWLANRLATIEKIEKRFPYPFIAKPVDDGCSAAVKKIDDRDELEAYADMIFREQEALVPELIERLELLPKEEFPLKERFLIENLIEAQQASHFLEITGGLLTHHSDNGIIYEIFEPSETLKTDDILSLEEKFLAGQGQNITPARYTDKPELNRKIAEKVKHELKKVAKALNIEGYARIDAFVRIFEDERVETIIIEVNSLPGMTPATCIFHQCAINGYKPFQFIDKIIEYGFEKFTDKVS